jgi:hypothetical protein
MRTKQEQVVWEMQCYGCLEGDLIASIEESFGFRRSGPGMCVTSMLSDCQELISMGGDGAKEELRQTLNRAKFLIHHYKMGTDTTPTVVETPECKTLTLYDPVGKQDVTVKLPNIKPSEILLQARERVPVDTYGCHAIEHVLVNAIIGANKESCMGFHFGRRALVKTYLLEEVMVWYRKVRPENKYSDDSCWFSNREERMREMLRAANIARAEGY